MAQNRHNSILCATSLSCNIACYEVELWHMQINVLFAISNMSAYSGRFNTQLLGRPLAPVLLVRGGNNLVKFVTVGSQCY